MHRLANCSDLCLNTTLLLIDLTVNRLHVHFLEILPFELVHQALGPKDTLMHGASVLRNLPVFGSLDFHGLAHDLISFRLGLSVEQIWESQLQNLSNQAGLLHHVVHVLQHQVVNVNQLGLKRDKLLHFVLVVGLKRNTLVLVIPNILEPVMSVGAFFRPTQGWESFVVVSLTYDLIVLSAEKNA